MTDIAERNRIIDKHYRSNKKHFHVMLSGKLGCNSEDAVQEAYTRALEYWHALEPKTEEAFEPWFSGILASVTRDALSDMRSNGSHSNLEEEDVKVLDYGFKLTDQEARVKLEQAIDLMREQSDIAYNVLRAVLLHGLTAKEASKILPVKPHYVRDLILRFRKQFLDA